MEMHVTFKQMDATDGLKTHVNEVTQRLAKFFDGKMKVTWICYLSGVDQVADLDVHTGQHHFFAKAKSPDLYRSIEDALDKVERQLVKHKEQLKAHHNNNKRTAAG